MRAHPITAAVFTVIGFLAASLTPMWVDITRDVYDSLRPIITEWTVENAIQDGDDLVVSGTMIKHRDCVFVPPTMARDALGRNYTVFSSSPTAGKSWAASGEPQHWGPWRVHGGIGKRLTFVNVYLCDGYPSVIDLGVYGKIKE
jgi:hypothetical protein